MLLELTVRISAAFWVSRALMGNQSDGVSSIAMQQGGIGLLLSTLIISVPPMAAMFFQGTLGGFSPYSVFGGGAAGSGRPAANGQPAGSGLGVPIVNQSRNDERGSAAGAFSESPDPGRTIPSSQPTGDNLKPYTK